MFLPKETNKQLASYQGRSSQENGTLLAYDDVFISHRRHVSSSCCTGAHDHCYLESKHTRNSCSTAQTVNLYSPWIYSSTNTAVPGDITSLYPCLSLFSWLCRAACGISVPDQGLNPGHGSESPES